MKLKLNDKDVQKVFKQSYKARTLLINISEVKMYSYCKYMLKQVKKG